MPIQDRKKVEKILDKRDKKKLNRKFQFLDKYDDEEIEYSKKKAIGFIYQENIYTKIKNYLNDGKIEPKILKEVVTKKFIISDFSKFIKSYQDKGSLISKIELLKWEKIINSP